MKDILYKLFILGNIGGIIYILIEILWRGYSHISMFILGGLCFLIIGQLNEHNYTWEMPLIHQILISAVVVTVLEFITGCIVNLGLGLNVWDYSNQPFNLLGQICLLYFFIWMPLSLVAILLDDYLRYKLFKEEKPRYKIL